MWQVMLAHLLTGLMWKTYLAFAFIVLLQLARVYHFEIMIVLNFMKIRFHSVVKPELQDDIEYM